MADKTQWESFKAEGNRTVHSLGERTAADQTAWAAPGVIAVDDRLVVAP